MSDIYDYQDQKIVHVLGSVLMKMYASVRLAQVDELSSKRPYIVMSEEKWSFKMVQWKCDKLKSPRQMPRKNCNQLILLRDLRSGADGRVWKACTVSGYSCVLKFGAADLTSHPSLDIEFKNTLKCNLRIRLAKFGGARCLMLPAYHPINDQQWRDKAVQAEVMEFIRAMYQETQVMHGDLKRDHILLISPSASVKAENMVWIDLRAVDDTLDEDDVRKRLHFE